MRCALLTVWNMGVRGLFFLIILSLWSHPLLADLENTNVLPPAVWSPKFIYGSYSGLSDRYNSSGLLEGATARYHLDLTGNKLAKLNDRVQTLVTALNGLSSDLGNKLYFGTLDFKANPIIDYFCPTLSHGLTKNLSIGLGIPIVHFQNSVQVVMSGKDNIQEIKDHVGETSHSLSDGLDEAKRSVAEIPALFQNVLVNKGYKPLRNVNYTALGDVQVSANYLYFNQNKLKLSVRPYIQLPTGQKDDPDDLVDVATGGQPAVGAYSVHEYRVLPKLTLASSVGYQANIEDRVSVRVPANADDLLPGPERKEEVQRKTGNSIFLEGGSRYTIISQLEVGAYYDFTQKDPDWYAGSKGWNYGALSEDSAAQTHQIKGLIEFNTISWFEEKTYAIPFILGYVYGNTFYAVNAPQQISNQLYMRMFF
jgi:hypothetical protein